jgi:CHAT domain-containing protein
MGVKGTKEDAFIRLPQTGALAGNIERVFGKDATLLEGRQAGEARLRDEDLSRYRYLVFATHGILDTGIPYIREPALVLSQVGNVEPSDGFLTMSEVMGLKLKAEVAALTACKTGLGRQVGGEGVMGMGRAFQYAGAKNVLVSLWSVAEESTTRFTAEFFTLLKEGKTPREALKLARAKIRSDARFDHPFFWAPFMLMGQ